MICLGKRCMWRLYVYLIDKQRYYVDFLVANQVICPPFVHAFFICIERGSVYYCGVFV